MHNNGSTSCGTPSRDTALSQALMVCHHPTVRVAAEALGCDRAAESSFHV